MSEIIVNSLKTLEDALSEIRDRWGRSKYLRIVVRERKRSLNQNDQTHVWYAQIAEQLREDTPREVKNFCKLHYGVPILRAEDSDFRKFYDKAIRVLPYVDKLESMDYVPVTSIMTVAQLKQYTDRMQAEYAKRGVILTFKNDTNDFRSAA